MLKLYRYNGGTFQFDDSAVPEGAVEFKAPKPAESKAAPAPKNKAVKPATKKA